ncbi:MAG: hypothetical protein R2741_02470 [Methanolobus sp.]
MAQHIKHKVIWYLKDHGPTTVEDICKNVDRPNDAVKIALNRYIRDGFISITIANPRSFDLTAKGREYLERREHYKKESKPTRVFFPIKRVVLPALLDGPQTAECLFLVSKHPDMKKFKGGLHRLVERRFLTVDKSSNPYRYRLTARGEEHALDPEKGIKEGVAKKRKVLDLSVSVKVKRGPETSTQAGCKKIEVRNVGAIEGEILKIMITEGAITTPDIRELARVHDYFTVRDEVLRFVHSGLAEMELTGDMVTYSATEAGMKYAKSVIPSTFLTCIS